MSFRCVQVAWIALICGTCLYSKILLFFKQQKCHRQKPGPEARTKHLPEYAFYLSLHGKPFLNDRNDDVQKNNKKRFSREEEFELSGVPVRQVQEDLVRDTGSWPRWLVVTSLISHPSSGRMLERPNSSTSAEDRDVILRSGNNEIKARLPVSPSPDFGLALCPDDRGSGLNFSQIEREGVCYSPGPSDSTSREQVCSVACLASSPSPDTRGVFLFQMSQPWPFATYCVTEITA